MLASPGDLVSADRVCTELSQRHPASKAVSSAEDTGPRPPPQPPAPQLGRAGPGTTHRARGQGPAGLGPLTLESGPTSRPRISPTGALGTSMTGSVTMRSNTLADATPPGTPTPGTGLRAASKDGPRNSATTAPPALTGATPDPRGRRARRRLRRPRGGPVERTPSSQHARDRSRARLNRGTRAVTRDVAARNTEASIMEGTIAAVTVPVFDAVSGHRCGSARSFCVTPAIVVIPVLSVTVVI